MTELLQLTFDGLKDLALRTCHDCHGTARVDDDQECYCVERFERRLIDAEFPDRFQDQTLADLEWEQILPGETRLALQHYSNDLPTQLDQTLGLGLIGPVGCGKTHCVVGLGKLAVALGYRVWFVNVPQLFHWLRQTYDPKGKRTHTGWDREHNRAVRREHEATLLEDLTEMDVLILDDLGAERPTDWVRERLYLVINQRWQTQRITLMTSNESLDQLETAIGARTLSRLVGDAVLLILNGADYRQPIGAVAQRIFDLRRHVCIGDGKRGEQITPELIDDGLAELNGVKGHGLLCD